MNFKNYNKIASASNSSVNSKHTLNIAELGAKDDPSKSTSAVPSLKKYHFQKETHKYEYNKSCFIKSVIAIVIILVIIIAITVPTILLQNKAIANAIEAQAIYDGTITNENSNSSIPTIVCVGCNASIFLSNVNNFRAASSKSMLKWNNTLSKLAGNYSTLLASQCIRQKSPLSSRPNQGETIYMKLSASNQIELDAFSDWIDDFDGVMNDKSQLLWSTSRTIGCGVSNGTCGNYNVNVVVCRFSPPGNGEGYAVL